MNDGPQKKRDVRTAHPEGAIDVCFDSTGTKILTCGDDRDVRVFGVHDLDLDTSFEIQGERGFAIACKGPRYFVGSDQNVVQSYNLVDGESETRIATFSLEVTCIATNSDGSLIAAGSGDKGIRVIRFEESTGVVVDTIQFLGHQGPILSVALDPRGIFLASSGADGCVKIWNILEKACCKTWNSGPFSLLKVNDFLAAKCLGRMSFEPKTGAILAVPFSGKVYLFDRDKWETDIGSLDSGSHGSPSIVAFSPCSRRIAVAFSMLVAVYRSDGNRDLLQLFQNPKKNHICALAWSPIVEDSILAYGNQGGFLIIEKVPKLADDSQTKLVSAQKSAASKPKIIHENFPIKDADEYSTGFPDDFETLSRQNAVPVESSNSNELDDELDSISVVDIKRKKPALVVPSRPITKMQKPFQSGSTPGTHRFMVWNDIGYMKTYAEDDGSNAVIDVVFHNTAFHRLIQISNTQYGFSMGTMNSKGYLLATEKDSQGADDDDSKSSKLKFALIGGQDEEWTITMDDGEFIEGIALGDNWCYAATDRGMLRVITHAGYQIYVLSIPGCFLTVAARQDLLMLAYHQSEPFAGNQNLAYSLYSMEKRHMDVIVQDQRLPISPKSELFWMGFGLRNSPCTVDNNGIMRVFHYKGPLQKIWSPCLDTRSRLKNKIDHYFVVGLDEETRQVRAIYCKGSRYPETLPLPTQTLLPLETLHAGLKDKDSAPELIQTEAECTLERLFPPKTEKGLTDLTRKVLKLFAMYIDNSQRGEIGMNRARDLMQALVPRSKDMDIFLKFARANCSAAYVDYIENLIMATAREEREEDVERPPTPNMFANRSVMQNDSDEDDKKRPSKEEEKGKKKKHDVAKPEPTTSTHKPVTLSRRGNPSRKSDLADTVKEFRKQPVRSDSDSDDEDLPKNPKSRPESHASSHQFPRSLHDTDEDTRMSTEDNTDEPGDSLLADSSRTRHSSDSRSNGASAASQQTLFMFDDDQPSGSRQSNGWNKDQEPCFNGSSKPFMGSSKVSLGSSKPSLGSSMPFMGSSKVSNGSSKPSMGSSKPSNGSGTTPGNPFRKAEDLKAAGSGGISTMAEKTESKQTKKSAVDENSLAGKKRGRKSALTAEPTKKKKAVAKSGSSEKKGSKIETEVTEEKVTAAPKTASIGLAKYGFSRMQQPSASKELEAADTATDPA